jgi:hypothetical protein
MRVIKPLALASAALMLLLASNAWTARAAEVEALIKSFKSVGPEGAGNDEATKAWKSLIESGPDALPHLLAAFEGANDLTANWLQTAVDAIAEKEIASGRSLSAEKMEAFVKDTKQPSRGRKAAYDLLVKIDSKATERLLPGMLNDPGKELRREAVAKALVGVTGLLEKKENEKATEAYRKLLTVVRDEDQIEEIAKQLKKFNVEVDLASQFGFIRDWALAAPFDNVGGVGFKAVYPPEKGVDLAATYTGKKDAKVTWTGHSTKDAHGVVNLNTALGKIKGATAYAFTVVESSEERPVEVRAGCINALKIYLNGKEIFFRDEYHHGMSVDQHIGRGTLKAGRNEILVKICQNEQTEQWAQEWQFQVRICDNLGGAIPIKVEQLKVKPKEKTEEGKVKP